MPAEAVLFDIDGTLIDSVDLHARAWQEAFEHFGKSIPFEEVRAQIGKGGDQLIPVFFPEGPVEKIDSWRSDLYKRKYLSQVRPFPRVRELFQEILRRGIRIALASSAKGEELKTYKKLTRIDDLIEAETSADDAERSKPHPDIFEAGLNKLGKVDRRRVFAVGDTPWDAIAAGRAGVRTIGVLCGGFPQADLQAAGCIAIYRDPTDLLERLDDSPLAR